MPTRLLTILSRPFIAALLLASLCCEAQAANYTETFTNPLSSAWTKTSLARVDGSFYASTPSSMTTNTATLSITLNNSTAYTLDWYVSGISLIGLKRSKFYVDGILTNTCSSGHCFQNISEGQHTLRWEVRTERVSVTSTAGDKIDNITFTGLDDADEDGRPNVFDPFPLNAAASSDTDFDGFPSSWNAACDATCQANSGLLLDNCPSNANADQLDTDGDSQGNACDTDDDNDGVLDASDRFPLDATETLDNDNDGIGNNADPDDDNDGVLDANDNCPLNANPTQADTDGDGLFDACSDADDDNDGVLDTSDKFPLNAAASSDTDVDGFPGSWNAACDATCQANSGLVLDNCPSNANADQLNTDGDTQGNVCDTDDDNDGLLDTADAFPLDNTQAGDIDTDGVDGFVDNCPSNANADQLNTDGDVQGNVCDTDDDNDGVLDTSDKFPLHVAASSDTDIDGFPGSWNAACDAACQANSGLILDNCPSNTNADQLDTDGDTQGNACDTDDDNDGVLDSSDNCPLTSNPDQADLDNDSIGDACDAAPTVAYAGSVDSSFNPSGGANNTVRSMALQADGKVLIGGYFTSVNGVARNYIASLYSDGSLDTGFIPNLGTGSNYSVESMALQADGKVLIGGAFFTVNGVARPYIARLNIDGSLDAGFSPNTSSYVLSMALQTDGKLLIGGSFTTVNGVARNHIARLNNDGSLDTSFNPGTGAGGYVISMTLQADGKLLIGGHFYSFNGVARPYIARLNSDGSLDTSFNPGTGTNSDVDSMTLQADGKLLIGGSFTTVNGVAHNYIARLHTGDSDFDGIEDGADKFPLDPAESIDTDHDGIGDNSDPDIDGDGVLNYIDADQLNPAIHTERSLLLDNSYKGSSVNEAAVRQ